MDDIDRIASAKNAMQTLILHLTCLRDECDGEVARNAIGAALQWAEDFKHDVVPDLNIAASRLERIAAFDARADALIGRLTR